MGARAHCILVKADLNRITKLINSIPKIKPYLEYNAVTNIDLEASYRADKPEYSIIMLHYNKSNKWLSLDSIPSNLEKQFKKLRSSKELQGSIRYALESLIAYLLSKKKLEASYLFYDDTTGTSGYVTYHYGEIPEAAYIEGDILYNWKKGKRTERDKDISYDIGFEQGIRNYIPDFKSIDDFFEVFYSETYPMQEQSWPLIKLGREIKYPGKLTEVKEKYTPKRNKTIEALIRKDVNNTDSWAKYADWLIQKNDPRGNLIALEIELMKKGLGSSQKKKLREQIDDYYIRYQDYWIEDDIKKLYAQSLIRAYSDPGYFSKPNTPLLRFGFLSSVCIVVPEKKFKFPLASLQLIRELKLEQENPFLALYGSLKNPLSRHMNSLCQLTQLKKLSLQGFNIKKLPQGFIKLKQLSLLNLAENQLTSVPTEIRHLKSLSSLNLDMNQITELSGDLEKLIQLQVLGLSENSISEIPGYFSKFTQLEFLDLSNNQLKQVPEELSNFKKLQALDLSENKLSKKLKVQDIQVRKKCEVNL